MKNHILKLSLTTAIGLLATGCSNTPQDDSTPLTRGVLKSSTTTEEEDALKQKTLPFTLAGDGSYRRFATGLPDYTAAEEQAILGQEAFPDDTFERFSEYETRHYKQAPLQPETKSLIKRIWSKLELEGFSGYNTAVLDGYKYTSEKVKFPSTDPIGGRYVEDAKNFTLRVLDLMLNQGLWKEGRRNLFGYSETLVGLNYNHNGGKKALLIAKDESTSTEKLVFADNYRVSKGYNEEAGITKGSDIIPNVLATDEEVPQALIDKWNKLFYDAIQEHGVFKDEFNPSKVLVGVWRILLPFAKATPTGFDTAGLTLAGENGGFIGLNLPIYIKFTGTITDNLTTPNLQTAAQYNLGNMAVGLTHNYANIGNGFNSNASFKSEATFFTTYYANNWFATAHIGGINAHTHNHAWQAATTALTLGYEHESGIRPFVELHRTQLNDYTQTIGFVGVDLDIAQHAVDSYSMSAKLKAAAGYSLQTQTFTPNLEWHGTLNLNSGVGFTSALTLSTADTTSINCSVQIER